MADEDYTAGKSRSPSWRVGVAGGRWVESKKGAGEGWGRIMLRKLT